MIVKLPVEPLGVDEKAAKGPDSEMLALVLFEMRLIKSYIASQGLYTQEVKG